MMNTLGYVNATLGRIFDEFIFGILSQTLRFCFLTPLREARVSFSDFCKLAWWGTFSEHFT